jgi:diguanylate cyclase (GGDEF)-like protein
MLIARLYDAARTDPLTKLANRRGLRELLDLELERARRGRTQASVLVGDIDGFKEFNDRLGSHAGDVALQRIALALDRGRRKFDGLARVGGEQFALVLPGTDESDACDIAESLRRGLGEEFASEKVPITISFGAATYPHHGETPGSLLHCADEALHAAKVNGRNRTVLYSAELGSSPRYDGESRDAVGERFVAVVLDLAEAVDLRFSGSARHSETVGRYTELIARELGFSEEQTHRLRLAGMLHDVGKVGVPDAVLNKPGSLTDEEFEVIKGHPALGAQILEHPTLADIREWVGAHHERPDGRGYPAGLAGDSIPMEAQILAVADAYEAMTSDRAYRSSIGREAAAAELERCSGTQFEPAVVDALINVLAGQEQRADLALARA